MRIIKGRYRNKSFNPPLNIKARPTTSKAKESLFNILENKFQLDVEGIDALDLFAGTGNISYELISREVKSLIAVEIDSLPFSYIKKTFDELKFDGIHVKTVKADAYKFLEICVSKFDFIYADPPYGFEKNIEVPKLVFKHKLLNPDGVFVMEHSDELDFTGFEGFVSMKSYGKVHLSFFKNS